MPRTDLLLACLLAGLAALSRIPLRAQLLPTWDAVQFALALRGYDVVRHQPHPPGYVLYVGAARALAPLLADPAQSFVWLAIGASVATVFATYRLAWMLFGRTAALVAAAGLLVSPLFWVNGLVGLPYTLEAAIATIVVSLVLPMSRGDARFAWRSGLALGVAGGVRQSALALLFPLWLGMAWGGLRRARSVLVGAGVMILTTLAWLVPMLWLAGGLARYLDASRELYDSTVRATTLAAPGGGWLGNARGLLEASLMGLGLFLPALVAVLAEGLRRGRRWGPREWLFAGWLLPPLAVYTGVHFGQYAYLLTVLPALYILSARWLVAVAAPGRPGLVTGVVAAVVVVHAVYVVAARPVDVPEPSVRAPTLARGERALRAFYRFTLWANTAPGLREQERVVRAYVEAIRRGFDPGDTVVVTELGNPRAYPWFRHATYYLPEFAVVHLRLGRFTPGYLASWRLASMRARPGPDVPLPRETRRLVWMVDSWNPTLPRPPGLEERSLPYGRFLYILDVGDRDLDYGGYRLTRAAR